MSAVSTWTTLPESVFFIDANGAVHSTGAEQENALPEQRGACLGDCGDAAGALDERDHGQCRADSFMIGWRTWRCDGRPVKGWAVNACPCDEGPEHRQRTLICQAVRRDDGAMAKQPREVEVAMRNALEPIGDALPRDAGALARCTL